MTKAKRKTPRLLLVTLAAAALGHAVLGQQLPISDSKSSSGDDVLVASTNARNTTSLSAIFAAPMPKVMSWDKALRKAGHYDDTKKFPLGPYLGGTWGLRWRVLQTHTSCVRYRVGGANSYCVLWTTGSHGTDRPVRHGVCRCDDHRDEDAMKAGKKVDSGDDEVYCRSWTCGRAAYYGKAVYAKSFDDSQETEQCRCVQEGNAVDDMRPGMSVTSLHETTRWEHYELKTRAEEAIGLQAGNVTWRPDMGRFCKHWTCGEASAPTMHYNCTSVTWRADRVDSHLEPRENPELQMHAQCSTWDYTFDRKEESFGSGACACGNSADASKVVGGDPSCQTVLCSASSMKYYSPPLALCVPLASIVGIFALAGTFALPRFLLAARRKADNIVVITRSGRRVLAPAEPSLNVAGGGNGDGNGGADDTSQQSAMRRRLNELFNAACLYLSMFICGPGAIPLGILIGVGVLMPYYMTGVFGVSLAVMIELVGTTILLIGAMLYTRRTSSKGDLTSPADAEMATMSVSPGVNANQVNQV